MAAIDLRSVTVFIKDGSTSTLAGAVNHLAGYPAVPPDAKSTSVITVSGFTGAVAIGQIITFATHLQYYTVVAHSETGGNTTSITIFPALKVALVNADVVTVVGNAVYAKIGEGNLTYNEKRNLTYIRDRGFIDTVKLGDEEPMDVSMDFTWEFLRGTSTTPPTFEEALKQIGRAAAWVSSSSDACEPYSVDIILLDIPPCGTDAEKIVLPSFRWESMEHDLKGAKIAIKGTCNTLAAVVTHTTP